MLQTVTECYRVEQSVTECYRLLQSISNRVLQNITEYYRVFLAHLLGPISGLVVVLPLWQSVSKSGAGEGWWLDERAPWFAICDMFLPKFSLGFVRLS